MTDLVEMLERVAQAYDPTDKKIAALIRELSARVASDAKRMGEMREALEGVLPDAELGAFLRDRCSSEYGDGYTQPFELTIQWDWQQSKPYTGGWGALQDDVDQWLAELREDGVETAASRARAALGDA